MLPSISLVVAARNEEKVIANCIKSLLNLDYPKDKLEIAVAIDGSTDNTLKICKKYKDEIVISVSEPKKNKGDALNSVLPKLRGEIVGFFDADCIVDKNCLKYVAKRFEDRKVAGVGGALKSYNENSNFLTHATSLETSFISFFEYVLSSLGANSHFFGKNMFIRKKILQKLGGFGTYSFLEDIELSLKMKRTGHKVVLEPNALAWHEEPSSLKSFLNQRYRWARGLVRLLKLKQIRSLKEFISDSVHGVYFYVSPFGLVAGTMMVISLLLGLPAAVWLPLASLFVLSLGLLVASIIYFKRPLKNLLYLPHWFVLSNIQIALFFKAVIDESMGKDMAWFKAERDSTKNIRIDV